MKYILIFVLGVMVGLVTYNRVISFDVFEKSKLAIDKIQGFLIPSNE